MKSTPLSQTMVVIRKELRDWSRDRRSILTVLASSLLAPGLIFFLFNSMASRQRQVEDVTIPIVGAAHAPAFVDWLKQQAGVTVVDGPDGPTALPAVEIVPESGVYDYTARYTAGLTDFHAPARLDAASAKAVGELAVAAHRLLGLRDVSRTDAVVAEDGSVYFLEVNVSPGLTETSLLPMAVEAAGQSLGEIYAGLIERAVAR